MDWWSMAEQVMTHLGYSEHIQLIQSLKHRKPHHREGKRFIICFLQQCVLVTETAGLVTCSSKQVWNPSLFLLPQPERVWSAAPFMWPRSQRASPSPTPRARLPVCCACGRSSPWKTGEEPWLNMTSRCREREEWKWDRWPHTYVTGYADVH